MHPMKGHAPTGGALGFLHTPLSLQGSITYMPNGCCKTCEYSWRNRVVGGLYQTLGRKTPGQGISGLLFLLCLLYADSPSRKGLGGTQLMLGLISLKNSETGS